MKVAIILIGFLAAVASAEEGKAVFKKCPDYKLLYSDLSAKVHLKDVLGLWNLVRVGPPHNEEAKAKFESVDCVREVFYQEEDKTPENTITLVKHARKDNEHKVCSGEVKISAVENDNVDNHFTSVFKDPENKDKEIHTEYVLVDTDHGENWGLWVACLEFEPSNTTVFWSIVSRYPWMDPKLEQTLVEKVEKYGGVGPSQLRGVGQSECYKQKDHQHVH